MTPEHKKRIEEYMKKEMPIGRTLGDHFVREAFKQGANFGYSLAMEYKGCKCCTSHNDEIVAKDAKIAGLKETLKLKMGDYNFHEHIKFQNEKISSLESALKVAEEALNKTYRYGAGEHTDEALRIIYSIREGKKL